MNRFSLIFLLLLVALGVAFVITPHYWAFIVLAILGLCGLGLSILKVRWLPLLIFAGLVLGQLARFKISGDSSSALLFLDGATALYTGFGIVYAFAAKKRFPRFLPTTFFLSLVVWMIATLVIGASTLTQSETLVAASYLIRFVLMVGALIVTYVLFDTEEAHTTITRGVLTSGALLLILGYAQLLLFPNFAFMAKFGWDPHDGRLLSTFFDPNFFGMFLTLFISVCLSLVLVKPNASKWLWLWIAVAILAILLTFSRSSYLALAISLFIILTIRSWRLAIIAMVLVILVAAPIPRVRDRVLGALQVDSTSQDRIQSWRETLEIVQKHPVTGVGYNAFGPVQVKEGFKKDLQGLSSRGSDSSLLLILATTGIVGLLLYCFFLFSLWHNAVVVYQFSASPYFRALGLAMIGIIPSYVVHSQFVNSLLYPLVFIPFALLVAGIFTGMQQLKHTKNNVRTIQ